MPALVKEPSKRHKDIAEIANHLGANITARDVKIVIEAVLIEHEHRSNAENFYIKDVAVLCKEVSYA